MAVGEFDDAEPVVVPLELEEELCEVLVVFELPPQEASTTALATAASSRPGAMRLVKARRFSQLWCSGVGGLRWSGRFG